MGLFSFLKNKDNEISKDKYLQGFSNTNNSLGQKIRLLFSNKSKNSSDFLEQLMITLIEADIGYKTANKICDEFSKEIKDFDSLNSEELLDLLMNVIINIYGKDESLQIKYNENGPTIILMIGVNGSGKTSTCAKLAQKFLNEGKTVALAAGDTFRAGASAQLNEWANRLNIHCVLGKENSDPSAVLVDGCKYALENKIDILICDTAGRLQNKVNLMHELEKMYRVVGKQIENAPHNCFLVLDANTGQNGLSQAQLFSSLAKLDGVILTKLDGTSKGGIIIAIKDLTNIPVKFITFGENIDDISDFNLENYLYSIIGDLKNV